MQPLHCRFCGKPLDVVERLRGGHCGDVLCLARHGQALEQARVERRSARVASVAADLGWARDPDSRRVLWLRPHRVRLVRLDRGIRQRMRDHLEAITEAAFAEPLAELDPATSRGQPGHMRPVPAIERALCGHCAGRCCRLGAEKHAYLDADTVGRWWRGQRGASVAGVVDAYCDHLPAWHVEDSCAFQGRHGCTLPREMRADICNRFACDALAQLQRMDPQSTRRGVLVARGERDLQDAALVSTSRTLRWTAPRGEVEA